MIGALRSMRLRALSVGSEAVSEAARQLAEASGGYTVDPHTGVGVAGLKMHLEQQQQQKASHPTSAAPAAGGGGSGGTEQTAAVLLCMACAHPAKFPDFVKQVGLARMLLLLTAAAAAAAS